MYVATPPHWLGLAQMFLFQKLMFFHHLFWPRLMAKAMNCVCVCVWGHMWRRSHHPSLSLSLSLSLLPQLKPFIPIEETAGWNPQVLKWVPKHVHHAYPFYKRGILCLNSLRFGWNLCLLCWCKIPPHSFRMKV
jgi:hypothetical protein